MTAVPLSEQGCGDGIGHGEGTMPHSLLTPSSCPCRVKAKSVMEVYFVYSNGTALDVNQLSLCVLGRELCNSTAAHPIAHPASLPLAGSSIATRWSWPT